MKTIGLIGGMSWESTQLYYRILNETMRARLGGLNSARVMLYSVNFAEIEAFQNAGRWDLIGGALADAAEGLERAGAECVVLATNTMHKVAVHITGRVKIPLLHIADATAEAVCAQGMDTIALLGTRFTMEEDFYKGRLSEKYGLKVIVPPREERDLIHRVIYDELCLGTIRAESRNGYAQIIEGLREQGAQGVILGCTEIGLLVKPEDSPVPLFDTTRIHAEAAASWAIQ
jgi:aspartate racemase